MNRITVFLLCCLLSAVYVRASDVPFAKLSDAVNKQWGAWHGSQQALSKLLAAERKRLGDSFQPELMKFLGDDPEKHYRIAQYLVSEEYLHGAGELPQLALLLQEQGIVLCRKGRGERSDERLVALLVSCSVLSSKQGLHYLARAHKSEVELLCRKKPALESAWPVLSDKEQKIYDAIQKPGTP